MSYDSLLIENEISEDLSGGDIKKITGYVYDAVNKYMKSYLNSIPYNCSFSDSNGRVNVDRLSECVYLKFKRIIVEYMNAPTSGKEIDIPQQSEKIYLRFTREYCKGSNTPQNGADIIKSSKQSLGGKNYDLKTACKVVTYAYIKNYRIERLDDFTKYDDSSGNKKAHFGNNKVKLEDDILKKFICGIFYSIGKEQFLEFVREIYSEIISYCLKKFKPELDKIKNSVVETVKEEQQNTKNSSKSLMIVPKSEPPKSEQPKSETPKEPPKSEPQKEPSQEPTTQQTPQQQNQQQSEKRGIIGRTIDFVKGIFKKIKEGIDWLKEHGKENKFKIGIVVVIFLFIVGLLFPYIKKLVLKIAGMIKYGISKVWGLIMKLIGKGGSSQQEAPALLEVYLMNKSARKIIESKIDKIDRLMYLYYLS